MNTVRYEPNVEYDELKEMANQIKRLKSKTERDNRILQISEELLGGKTVINMRDTIIKAGAFRKNFPKLALGKADKDEVHCKRAWRTIEFASVRWGRELSDAYYEISGLKDIGIGEVATTLIPFIPVHIRPQENLEEYNVLFEVSEWTNIATLVDPILCRRLYGDLFVVEAIWDMTELEVYATGL